MSLRSQLAYLAAGLTVILGLLGLLNPILVLRITGLDVVEPRGLGEARALFGAMFLTMGGFMLWALAARPRARTVLRFAAFLWLASGLGRLLGLLIDGPFSIGSVALLAFDLVVGAGAYLGSTEAGRERDTRKGESSAPEPNGDDPLRAYRP